MFASREAESPRWDVNGSGKLQPWRGLRRVTWNGMGLTSPQSYSPLPLGFKDLARSPISGPPSTYLILMPRSYFPNTSVYVTRICPKLKSKELSTSPRISKKASVSQGPISVLHINTPHSSSAMILQNLSRIIKAESCDTR